MALTRVGIVKPLVQCKGSNMSFVSKVIFAAAVAAASASSMAQVGSPGPKTQLSGPASSGPDMGMGRGGHWGRSYTPGWAMMTQQERDEHRERMRSMQSYDECKAYRQQHHEKMVERAKERGAKPPLEPRRDACGGLKR